MTNVKSYTNANISSLTAWYFTADNTVGFGDKRIIEEGATLEALDKDDLFNTGMRGSPLLIDALMRSNVLTTNNTLWCVALTGKNCSPRHGDAKQIRAEQALYLASIDVTQIMDCFARRVALSTAGMWKMPEVVRLFLETGDESLKVRSRHAALDAVYLDSGGTIAWAAYAASESGSASSVVDHVLMQNVDNWEANKRKFNKWLEQAVAEDDALVLALAKAEMIEDEASESLALAESEAVAWAKARAEKAEALAAEAWEAARAKALALAESEEKLRAVL